MSSKVASDGLAPLFVSRFVSVPSSTGSPWATSSISSSHPGLPMTVNGARTVFSFVCWGGGTEKDSPWSTTDLSLSSLMASAIFLRCPGRLTQFAISLSRRNGMSLSSLNPCWMKLSRYCDAPSPQPLRKSLVVSEELQLVERRVERPVVRAQQQPPVPARRDKAAAKVLRNAGLRELLRADFLRGADKRHVPRACHRLGVVNLELAHHRGVVPAAQAHARDHVRGAEVEDDPVARRRGNLPELGRVLHEQVGGRVARDRNVAELVVVLRPLGATLHGRRRGLRGGLDDVLCGQRVRWDAHSLVLCRRLPVHAAKESVNVVLLELVVLFHNAERRFARVVLL
eukprot:Opistho-1_new@11603